MDIFKNFIIERIEEMATDAITDTFSDTISEFLPEEYQDYVRPVVSAFRRNHRNTFSRDDNNNVMTQVDTLRGRLPDIQRGNSNLDGRVNVGTSTPMPPFRERTMQIRSHPQILNNLTNNSSNNINTTMSQTSKGVALAGAGTGNPKTDPHALGNQNAADTYDVGFIKPEIHDPLADAETFKMYYCSHASNVSLANSATNINNLRNVFQNSFTSGIPTTFTATASDKLVEFARFRLNSCKDPVRMLGKNDRTNTNLWRSEDFINFPLHFKKMAEQYKHYKVKQMNVTMNINHIGDASNPLTGMPVALYGWRINTHNKGLKPPTRVGEIIESHYGFKICDHLYPSININKTRNVTVGGSNNIDILPSVHMQGSSHYTYKFSYSPDSATTEVDLDGTLNNKALWAATDSQPPEEQELIIYAVPLFDISSTGLSTTSDTEYTLAFKDAALKCDIIVNIVAQFRDRRWPEEYQYPAPRTDSAGIVQVGNGD